MNEQSLQLTRRISGIKLSLDEVKQEEFFLIKKAARFLGIKEEKIVSLEIHKKSLDARAHSEPFFLYSLDIIVYGNRNKEHTEYQSAQERVQQPIQAQIAVSIPKTRLLLPPLIVGAGPAGLFAALALAKAGYKPILIEQGQAVEQRLKDVELFWLNGKLNEKSNVQFGEGGAGAFSDGKLTFRGKDPLARSVLKTLVELGAPPAILYWHKPHLGSDKLCELLPLLRYRIEKAGGRIVFGACVTDIVLKHKKKRRTIEGLIVSGAMAGEMPAQAVILATGNGARGVFNILSKREVALSAKAFAAGLRIEHSQHFINTAQYGLYAEHTALLPADYVLKYRAADNRSFYSFCMCPGGRIVNASSEKGALVVNGISLAARASGRANSALVGEVKPGRDFIDDPLSALAWQEDIEKAAYLAGGGNYALPVCLAEDFIYKSAPQAPPPQFAPLSVAFCPADLHSLLPEALAEGLTLALKQWQRQIRGFAEQAVLAAPESRTSSPIRILRGADGQSINVSGLYPAGEGAGYAGGILSSACDGLRAAAAICEQYAPPK